jgi:lipoyl(octanoyl) transferase
MTWNTPGISVPHSARSSGASTVADRMVNRTDEVDAAAALPRPLEVRRLGTMPYAEALALQADLVKQRRSGEIPDTLLLLEHPHVITLGSGSHAENVLVSADERATRKIELHETGRGGDVTYHGPGQLVGYPILDLKPDRCDVHAYLRDLEQVLIHVVARFGLRAERLEGLTGVWVEDRKLAAIGVRVSSGWITSHGFALNVSTDLSFFQTIVPCGIRQHGVSSIARELGTEVPFTIVQDAVVAEFAALFSRDLPGSRISPAEAPGRP